jgi:hypothetical protein
MASKTVPAIPRQSTRDTIRAGSSPETKAAIARGELATWEGALAFIRSTTTIAERRQRTRRIRGLLRRGGLTERDRWLAEGSLQLLLATAAQSVRI